MQPVATSNTAPSGSRGQGSAPASAPASDAATIIARGVTRRFGDKVAVAGIDLVARPGITGLLGPNGSGKSTFLRCLYGLVRPDSGEIEVAGAKLAGDGVAIRRRASYAPGEIALYGEMSAREHLAWLLRGREAGAFERALELAARLELPIDKRVRSFSHGMKRQLLVCAALAPSTSVRILDEPTEGLDPTKRGQVLEMLFEDAARGTTILLSSHHLGEVDRACARLVFVQAGRILADETTTAVKARAARVVRVAWPAQAEAERLERLVRDLGGASLEWRRVDGELRASARVEGEPRAWLARLLSLPGLPAPLSIEHGRLSLSELYRELYGVEGC